MKRSMTVRMTMMLISGFAAADSILQDKTLVAWVSPANLTQRGGSVLTLDDQKSHFDGIVFGEIEPAKWMAGSDNFSRTEKQQEAWPAETAEAGLFVQVADPLPPCDRGAG